jgi:transcriptional regulator with XRE-family HTH domain
MIDPTVQPNGQKIKALRKALKLSQYDLAEKAVCSKRTVENAEAGKRVKESVLNDIAAELNVAVSELICDRRLTPPTDEGEVTYRGRAKFSELNALGDGQVGELASPLYYGESESAILTTHGAEACLTIENLTIYDDASCSQECQLFSGCLEGRGLYVGGSVYIQHTVVDQRGQRRWAGVCVLRVPPPGKEIHGYWMTAGHTAAGKTVLGLITLVEVKRADT